jgi:hypothetical protein
MVLKEMHLPTATYEGSPAEPVSGTQPASALIDQPPPGSGQIKPAEKAVADEESRLTMFWGSDD